MPERKTNAWAVRTNYQAFANRKAELYLYGMQLSTVARGWSCRPHLHHRMLEVNLVLQGVQTAIIDGETRLQRQDELLLIPPMHKHHYEMKHSGELQFFVMHIQVGDPGFMQLLQRMEPLHVGAGNPLHSQLLPIVKDMLESLKRTDGSSIQPLRLAYGLMGLIEEGLRLGSLPSTEPVLSTAAAIALEIERLLLQGEEDAAKDDFNEADGAHRNWLDRISDKLGISSRHCSRVFREAYRMTPRHYYSMLRQQEAMHLLLNTDDTLGAIAGRIGFENVQSFIRQFVKWTGETPGRYRQIEANQGTYLTPLEIR